MICSPASPARQFFPALFRPVLVAGLLLTALFPQAVQGQDRNIPMNIVFPPGAFKENGGPVLDITKPPFNAVGDGVTDDTQAFIRAMNFLRDEIATARKKARHPYAGRHDWTLYLPNGTYLVSDTIIHEGSIPHGFAFLRLVGQDRNKTIIRLKDESPGFGPGREKPVLAWSKLKEAQGNIMWGNQARNFTIDTGSGNPGAVGMTFMGANAASMDNITIRSGDGAGQTGLSFPWWSLQGHFCDITVEGFDYGIRTEDPREIQPALEYITLKNQNIAGMDLGPAVAASIRKLHSINSVPALMMLHPGAHVVLVESKLEGGLETQTAILLMGGGDSHLFVRDVEIIGYGSSVNIDGEVVATGSIDEFLNGEITAMGQTPKKSMRLPVEEAALVPRESNPENWASPEDFEGTEPERIQAALSSGKPAVYFPKSYRAGGDFKIPATVRQIDFLHLDEVKGTFTVAEASDEPLWIEHSQRRLPLILAAPRTVHARYGSVRFRVETKEPVSVHFQNQAVLTGGHTDKFCPPNVRMYARSINDEDRSHPNYVVNGGLLWVLGYKTEAHQESFMARNGGFLEVLGGYRNHAGSEDKGLPMIANEDSHVSVIASTYMSRRYAQAIWDTRGGQTVKLGMEKFPVRKTGHINNYFVPLFVSYDPAKVPAN